MKKENKEFYQVSFSILLQKTRQRQSVNYCIKNKLWHLSLSKSVQGLCHVLIYDVAIYITQ